LRTGLRSFDGDDRLAATQPARATVGDLRRPHSAGYEP
jgi:hypothetical protein